MILIGQIGERVDLGEVGAEGIAELIGAVAAVGVGAVGVDGTAGVDVAVVIAGSGGVAEVKQIILGILYAGKAVTAVSSTVKSVGVASWLPASAVEELAASCWLPLDCSVCRMEDTLVK